MQRATDRPYGAPLSAAGLKERLYTTQHQTQTRHQEQAQREFVAMRVTCCNTHLSLHWQIQSQRGAYFYITTAQYNVHKVFQDTYTKSEPSTQEDCSAANTLELCNVHAECSEVMCQRPTQTHSASLYQPNNRHLLHHGTAHLTHALILYVLTETANDMHQQAHRANATVPAAHHNNHAILNVTKGHAFHYATKTFYLQYEKKTHYDAIACATPNQKRAQTPALLQAIYT